ncbi:SNF2-related protein [Klebsiella aerogenes]|uniref:DEAD/DEAH box helicase n=1 Tax=Enterobacterales TaxID=91347 RepID=UPI00163CBCAB|nr:MULTISPECIES: SNF2-related protein [Enterobacterales]MCI4186869.1 SNF2-related protein [Dickeya dianthicola]MDQ9320076.1 SNF2-related protein [Klebsiella aerogenes]HCM5461923.1 DEAD/DEAH box helicase family protein [Klebsiella aerogenes]
MKMIFQQGQQVRHERFGLGTIELLRENTALIRFESSFEERPLSELEPVRSAQDALAEGNYDDLREVLARSQALAIRSINDSWGVFSTSRINLLPHQLWVCHRVLRQWPVQKLIADDVGLGKTVEAGLILWPLLAKKRVQRLLVLAPASLVPQWQERLRQMFDIRLSLYSTEIDTERSDYWNTHPWVVASLPTLRKDINGRHERMLKADDWDLLIIDEAHHLNSLEDSGATQGYRFVQKLIDHGKFASRLFFTATPHRGKNYGFFALLRLLRPDLFDVNKPFETQQHHVRDVVIRNNKQTVTNMDGERLFKTVNVTSQTYHFSEAEQSFYDRLTRFILSGQAYASSLSSANQQAVQLVLTAMQKLAASSVAAIYAAINGRIARLGENQKKLQALSDEMNAIMSDSQAPDLDDAYIALESEYVEMSASVQLMQNELPMLEELQALAGNVESETKIQTLLNVLETTFLNRTVVFFTEYKATQALLINTLNARFGYGCVSFINGEGRLEGIYNKQGVKTSWSMDRYHAAEQFKSGQVRFIVCTEAGGEGIDLQDNCYSMIHVDLPWNPMRLHQRVGRLNRYGQKHQVEVITLRNPDTVESRIWDLLNSKITTVMRSLGDAMEEPEDLLQLILGMSDKGFFNSLFADGLIQKPETLNAWFDSRAGTFGGQSAVSVVKGLVGHADKFEYQNLQEVPKLDLNNMYSFLENMLKLNGHRLENEGGTLSFVTPKEWINQFGIKKKYNNMTFDRISEDKSLEVLGVGHVILNNAIAQAEKFNASTAVARGISAPLLIYILRDQITGDSNVHSFTVVGVLLNDEPKVLVNDDLVHQLSVIYEGMPKGSPVVKLDSTYQIDSASDLKIAEISLEQAIPSLNLPYEKVSWNHTATFIPQ